MGNGLVVSVDQVEDLGGRELVPDLVGGQVHTSGRKDLLKTANDVVAQVVLAGDALNDIVGSVSEAEGLVETSAVQVPSGGDVCEKLSGDGEAGEDDAVGVLGVEGGEPVGLDAAEGVANVDDLLVCTADLWDLALTQLCSDRVEGFDFRLCLDPEEKT